MESLEDILGKKNFTPPDEIAAVKDYVKRHYKSSCGVKLQRDTLVISVFSSALAGTLQMEKPRIIKACGIKQKLVIRIGS